MIDKYRGNKFDTDIFNDIHVDDLWVYDKLILSRKLGYRCGPDAVKPTEDGWCMVRPISNYAGMGKGAEKRYLYAGTDTNRPGTFWCEYMTGRHISVDYAYTYHTGYQPFLTVEGEKKGEKFIKWSKIDHIIPKLPSILHGLNKNYLFINCEYIGGKLIEAHFRRNPDFSFHNHSELIPVWHEWKYYNETGYVRLEAKDGDRLGFLAR